MSGLVGWMAIAVTRPLTGFAGVVCPFGIGAGPSSVQLGFVRSWMEFAADRPGSWEGRCRSRASSCWIARHAPADPGRGQRRLAAARRTRFDVVGSRPASRHRTVRPDQERGRRRNPTLLSGPCGERRFPGDQYARDGEGDNKNDCGDSPPSACRPFDGRTKRTPSPGRKPVRLPLPHANRSTQSRPVSR